MRRLLIAALLFASPALAGGNGAWFGGLSPGFKPAAAGGGSGVFAEDNFTDTTGDLLTTQHTMDTGGTWTANGASSSGQMTFSDANRVYTSTSPVYIYPSSATPSDADYSVTMKFRVRGALSSSSHNLGVGLRYSTSALSGYHCTVNNTSSGNATLTLKKNTTGTTADLTGSPSSGFTYSAGDEFILKIKAVGDQITCELTGAQTVTIGPATDSTYPTAGIPMIRGNTAGTNTTGYHAWYYKADNTP